MRAGALWERTKRRLTPEVRRTFQYGWEALNFGVLGLNSFVMLYLHTARASIRAVICAGIAGYALVFPLQAILCRRRPRSRRLERFRLTKKVFRLVYTAIYLTAIMLDILAVPRRPDAVPLLVYYSVLAVWVILWGTNCFWGIRLWRRLRPVLARVIPSVTEKAPAQMAEKRGGFS